MLDADGKLLLALEMLAREAGAKALDIYARPIAADIKDDRSPVTEADRLGEEIILAGLARLAPSIPTLAEEQASIGAAPPALGAEFFLVDPLDGTREFISRNGEFTVNIALIRDGAPALGVVHAPALGALYAGRARAGASMVDNAGRRDIRARPVPPRGLVAVASRSHRSPETDAFLATLDVADFSSAGSSLKFCLVAEGRADVYPRFGRTMEWDTAAGHAVLAAAGGRVVTVDTGAPLAYGKADRGYDNPHFIAWGAGTDRQ